MLDFLGERWGSTPHTLERDYTKREIETYFEAAQSNLRHETRRQATVHGTQLEEDKTLSASEIDWIKGGRT